MATASRPALAAPEAPMATVATGTPFGICTIDSSESSPFNAALCMGTPMTGTTVYAATTPARWAAPPAPAMMTCRPRLSSGRRVLRRQCRRAVRGDDFRLVGHAKPLQDFGGLPHGVPVRLAAHDDAHERRWLCHGAIKSCSW